MFFDQEWHPDQCGCSQCHHEEQQVLSQFENEMNRLEDEVQKTNEFTSIRTRHIETEWPAEEDSSLEVSDHSAEPPQEALTIRNPCLPHSAAQGRDEGTGRKEEGDSKDSRWTGRREQQKQGEAATSATDDEVGLSFANEMYKQYEVRHVMHEQWPPAQAWAEPCGESDHHYQYSNGTHHHQHYQFDYNNYDSNDNDSDHLDAENNNNYHDSQAWELGEGGRFSAANQDRYNDCVSAKKSKRKLTLRVKDSIKRRYHSLRPLASISYAEVGSYVGLATPTSLASFPRWYAHARGPLYRHTLNSVEGAGGFVANSAIPHKRETPGSTACVAVGFVVVLLLAEERSSRP